MEGTGTCSPFLRFALVPAQWCPLCQMRLRAICGSEGLWDQRLVGSVKSMRCRSGTGKGKSVTARRVSSSCLSLTYR